LKNLLPITKSKREMNANKKGEGYQTRRGALKEKKNVCTDGKGGGTHKR